MALKTKTEHPHIVRVKEIRGGRPVIKDTGIEVALIVKLHKMGESVDEILALYPHLAPAAVYDALSYYHDHQKEIEHLIADQDIQVILEQNDLTIDSQGHILPRIK
ncbi:MAG: hypothetical protein HW384_1154 [Dehalococcoidia bacterium]|nr:hypothetical protein [Dehalococcoidia bacterium]